MGEKPREEEPDEAKKGIEEEFKKFDEEQKRKKAKEGMDEEFKKFAEEQADKGKGEK